MSDINRVQVIVPIIGSEMINDAHVPLLYTLFVGLMVAYLSTFCENISLHAGFEKSTTEFEE